ncbi:MAG: 8-amino-7-oxononanoate synthase [Thermodesulfobacteriota bacterium]
MDELSDWLDHQQAKGLLRRLPGLERLPGGRIRLSSQPDQELLDFSSNDYLALSVHPAVIAAAQDALARYGAGAGASRLMSGDLALHHALEEEVAGLKGKEAALAFGSGYQANSGIIPALVGRNDLIFSDRLNHASIVDGCLLSGARLLRFRHNDPEHLESLLGQHAGRGTALIVVESLYSMDGDICPLDEIVRLKERYRCLLMVDEAHATGVFGARGGGIVEEAGLGEGVDLAMGTFGKALGSYGAYVAARRELIDYLVNRARSFIFSTALPPPVVAASLAAVRLVRDSEELRRELWGKVALFKKLLRQAGCAGDLGPSQIVPLHIGDNAAALAAAEALRHRGIFATAVRPPTVPEGTARLRFSITRHHGATELAAAARALAEVLPS